MSTGAAEPAEARTTAAAAAEAEEQAGDSETSTSTRALLAGGAPCAAAAAAPAALGDSRRRLCFAWEEDEAVAGADDSGSVCEAGKKDVILWRPDMSVRVDFYKD